MNYNVAQQVQTVKDMFAATRERDLMARIQNLELAQATAGVMRYPNQWAYNAGVFPPAAATGG